MRAALWIALVTACGRYSFGTVDDGGAQGGDGGAGGDGTAGDGGSTTHTLVTTATLIDNGARVDCPKLASDGTSFAVIWWDDRLAPNSTWLLYFRRFDEAGTPLGGELMFDAPGADSAAGGCGLGREVIWTGSQYAVIYTSTGTPRRQVMLANIAADGTQIGAALPLTPAATDSVLGSARWLGSQLGVAYTEHINASNRQVRHVNATLAGVLSNDAPVSSVFTGRSHPALAASASGEAIVWYEIPTTSIHYAHVAGAAQNDVAIAMNASTNVGQEPASIRSGADQIVAFMTSTNTLLLRVDPATAAARGPATMLPAHSSVGFAMIAGSLALTSHGAKAEFLDGSAQVTGNVIAPPTQGSPSAPSLAELANGELGFAWAEVIPTPSSRRIRFARYAP